MRPDKDLKWVSDWNNEQIDFWSGRRGFQEWVTGKRMRGPTGRGKPSVRSCRRRRRLSAVEPIPAVLGIALICVVN
jgi:hypothetical protein